MPVAVENVSVSTPPARSRRRGRMTPIAARRSLYADRWLPRYRAALLRELNAITVRVARQVAAGIDFDEAVGGAWAWRIALDRIKQRWLIPTAAQGYDLAGMEVAHQAGLKSVEDIFMQTEARLHGKAQAARKPKRQPLPVPQPEADPVIIGRPATKLNPTGDFLLEGNFDNIDQWIATTSAAEVDTKVKKMRATWKKATASRDPKTGLAWTPRDIAKEMVRTGAAEDKVQATMLARTGTIWSMNEGAVQRYANAGVTSMTWLTTSDDLRCDWCLEMDGRTVRTGDSFWGGGSEFGVNVKRSGGGTVVRSLNLPYDVKHPPLHPNCFVGETPVVSPDKVAGFVATYSGPVVEIAFANSSRITVTPNHMLLTPRGFVRVASLREGDDVVDGFALQRIVSSGPDDNHKPSLIFDVVEALAKSSEMPPARVPVPSEYFHGDARFFQGDVDIVGTDSLLRYCPKTSTAEPLRESLLLGTDSKLKSFAGCGDLASVLFALGLASHGGMSWRSEGVAFRGRESRHPEFVRLASGAYADASTSEVSTDTATSNVESIGDGEFGLPRDVPTTHVTSLHVRQFSGHVYDIQSLSGLYLADGILSSNCRCTLVPNLTEQQAYGVRGPGAAPKQPAVSRTPPGRKPKPVAVPKPPKQPAAPTISLKPPAQVVPMPPLPTTPPATGPSIGTTDLKPARTIAEAQENARKMGVDATYSTTDVDLANAMNETLNEARNAGFALPKHVQIDASLFTNVKNRRNNPASYLFSLDDVVVNPGADFWKNSVVDAAANKSSRFWTTASTRHPLRHELGHAIHKSNIGLSRFRSESSVPLDKAQRRLVRKNVSRYGSRDRGEFVAEVFSGLMDGASYADPVMSLYKKFGGPIFS